MTATKTTVPAGYRLVVVSWENDGDHYNTVTVDGLSKEKLQYFVDLCWMLHDKNPINDQFSKQFKGHDQRLNNQYDPNDDEMKNIWAEAERIVKAHPVATQGTEGEPNSPNFADYGMQDLYDLGLTGGEYTTRVCQSYKVFFIEKPIVLTDVTDEFKK